MKSQQCPACGHKVNLKQAAATQKVNGTFMLQCANCREWSHESNKAAAVKNLGLLMLLTGSVMGYFQFGGIISGPLIAFTGAVLAFLTVLSSSREIYTAS